MTHEDYLNLRSRVNVCNRVLSHKCTVCKSNTKCKDYLLLKQIDEERARQKAQANGQEA